MNLVWSKRTHKDKQVRNSEFSHQRRLPWNRRCDDFLDIESSICDEISEADDINCKYFNYLFQSFPIICDLLVPRSTPIDLRYVVGFCPIELTRKNSLERTFIGPRKKRCS